MDVSHDAVIVLPGIMGSELVETATGRVLWGMADLGWYVHAWTRGDGLGPLRLTEAERDGQLGRVTATRTLRSAAFAPLLRGAEPYRLLLDSVRRVVPDPAAVCEFAYDWRLSVAHNAGELAKVAEEHLRAWRAHPRGSLQARLVLVAHSMGGLIARYFTGVLGSGSEVRTTITLGTPYFGAAKAAYILSAGRGGPLPLPRRRLRELVATMPGLHDLLPAYRCVEDGGTLRRLTPSDVAGLGGDADLATQSAALHARLTACDNSALRCVVGVEQPTVQSLRLADGVAEPLLYLDTDDPSGRFQRVDHGGDGTVYRQAAAPAGIAPAYLPQTHTGLAKTPEALSHIRSVITETLLGPPLGVSGVGVDVPDVVTVGVPFEVGVLFGDRARGQVSCRIVHADTGRQVATPSLVRATPPGRVTGRAQLNTAGVFRVEVKGGGFSAVTQLLMAAGPDDGVA